MKRAFITIALLFCCIVSAHPFQIEKASGNINEDKAKIQNYLAANNDSLLKVYKDGKWENWDGSNKSNVYVISHGLNDRHDKDWITETAEAIKGKDSNAVILSVNWDRFSGTDKSDPNWLASTWINPVSELLSEQLSGADIKHAVGHSYGAHLLAKVVSQTDLGGDGKVGRLVGLDPADENGTLVSSGLTIWNSDEIKKFWAEATAKTKEPVETYKSSVVCGTELPLGDYNFLLADPGKISPKAVGGDWGGGGLENHSLAPKWYAEIVKKKAADDTLSAEQMLGGWFNDEVNKGVDTTDKSGNKVHEEAAKGQGTWTGVVNTADSSKLDYLLSESKATGVWGKVFTHMGLDTVNWGGTVLNPNQQANFLSQFDVQTTTDKDGNKWEYDPKTGQVFKNGTLYTASGTIGTTWQDSSGTGNINSLTDYLDNIMQDVKTMGQDVLDDALDALKTTWNTTTGSLWDKLKASGIAGIQGGINSLKANAKILIKKYCSLEELKKIADLGLQKLLEKNPTLKKILSNLGLDNINNIVGLCKDVFNLVRGLLKGGSFLTLLKSSDFLKGVLKNALGWGLDILKNLVSGLLTKFLKKPLDWLGNFVNKIISALGIKAAIDFQALVKQGIDAALDAGTKWIQNKVDSVLPSPPGWQWKGSYQKL